MPQVFKRTGSPYYYARFQFRGEDHVVSTKKRTKPEAEQELDRLMAEAKGELTIGDQLQTLLGLIEQLPAEQHAAKRQELAREILRDQDRKVAVANGFEVWRDNANKEYDPKESTLLGYEAIWKRFKKWAEASKITFFHEVTREHAEDYASDLPPRNDCDRWWTEYFKPFLRNKFTDPSGLTVFRRMLKNRRAVYTKNAGGPKNEPPPLIEDKVAYQWNQVDRAINNAMKMVSISSK